MDVLRELLTVKFRECSLTALVESGGENECGDDSIVRALHLAVVLLHF